MTAKKSAKSAKKTPAKDIVGTLNGEKMSGYYAAVRVRGPTEQDFVNFGNMPKEEHSNLSVIVVEIPFNFSADSTDIRGLVSEILTPED